MMKVLMPVLLAVLLGVRLFAGGAGEPGQPLRCAIAVEPTTLDMQVSSSDIGAMIAQHLFEGLYTFDASYNPVPLLVASETTRNDGTIIDIELRQGVTFHNGKELTAEDVIASLDRWATYGIRGPVLFDQIDAIEQRSKYGFTIYFSEFFGPWRHLLAFIDGGPIILPSEIASRAGGQPIEMDEYIGTGPYQFVDWMPGRHILLRRYETYGSRSESASGYSGERIAHIEELRFIPVTDMALRVHGIQTGDYEYAHQIQGDLYQLLNEDPNVMPVVNRGAAQGMLFFNSNGGILRDNDGLRGAILAAIDMRVVLRAAIGPEDLWEANGSIMPNGTEWYSERGIEPWNQADPELARSRAAAAGYRGEPIRFMASRSHRIDREVGREVAMQLEAAGFTIELLLSDWPTFSARRSDAEQWDIFFANHGFVSDPILYSFLSERYPGWWATTEKRDLVALLTGNRDADRRLQLWEEIQTHIYNRVPIIKIGDIFTYDIHDPRLQGVNTTSLIWPRFWGVDKR